MSCPVWTGRHSRHRRQRSRVPLHIRQIQSYAAAFPMCTRVYDMGGGRMPHQLIPSILVRARVLDSLWRNLAEVAVA